MGTPTSAAAPSPRVPRPLVERRHHGVGRSGSTRTVALAAELGIALNMWAASPARLAAQVARSEVTGPARRRAGGMGPRRSGPSGPTWPAPVPPGRSSVASTPSTRSPPSHLGRVRRGPEGPGHRATFGDGVPTDQRLAALCLATINRPQGRGPPRGKDVIDLGFGNPDLPSPDIAVEKPPSRSTPKNHATRPRRASRSARGPSPPLRAQVRRRARPGHRGGHHHRCQGGLLAPHVGAARPGRHRPSVPSPSYPIHILRAALHRGGGPPGPTGRTRVRRLTGTVSPGDAFLEGSRVVSPHGRTPRRGALLPAQPTTACVDSSS